MAAHLQTHLNPLSSDELIADLQTADAYPQQFKDPIVLHETHVSWVLLAGEFAYKIKKPLKTGFLDYSTLALREQFCHEEIRLDHRYTPNLYLGVVPITLVNGHAKLEATGPPIEFAVKMRRFPEDALLSHRIKLGQLSSVEVRQLAASIATFHQAADRWTESSPFATTTTVTKDFHDCLDDLAVSVAGDQTDSSRNRLKGWAAEFMAEHSHRFETRIVDGFIRECHGDLHLNNVVQLGNRLVPFDGIEFNDSFRWIDILNDTAFLVMDFAAHDHKKIGLQFLNAYLEQTGDYESLMLLRWYLVYRALVRAKVAAIRAGQEPGHDSIAQRDCTDHILLAEQFAHPRPVTLWITHGLSGSGKTTISSAYANHHGAIRLRSDVERKRLLRLATKTQTSNTQRDQIYSSEATEQTYKRLLHLADKILRSGFSVVVDATFLKQTHRVAFQNLARRLNITWGILDCEQSIDVLRDRITARQAAGTDASDADLGVLEHQIATQEPLTPLEHQSVVTNLSETQGRINR